MSKLAHSTEETMLDIEIRSHFEEEGAGAFETFASASLSHGTIKRALGQGIADEYSQWIYFNLK